MMTHQTVATVTTTCFGDALPAEQHYERTWSRHHSLAAAQREAAKDPALRVEPISYKTRGM